MSKDFITLEHITKSFDSQMVLDDLNLTLSLIHIWAIRLWKNHAAFPDRRSAPTGRRRNPAKRKTLTGAI